MEWDDFTNLCPSLPKTSKSEDDGPFVFLDHLIKAHFTNVLGERLTLMQKRRENGSVTSKRRALIPVSKRAHGPGPVGSAATECP